MRLTGGSPGRILDGPSFIWRRRGLITGLAGLVTSALVGTTIVGAPAASASSTETVIVTASGLLSPVTAVTDVLGTVLTRFHIIDGVEASIPAALEPLLAALPGITVTPDVSVNVQSTVESTGPHTPSDEFLQQTGATQLFASGDTGQGVTVAVLDTGIDDLPDFAGRLLGGVDLTGGNDPFQDAYGHGTFVAGLIAGDGASSGGQYEGEAPGADLVSIKVAGATGVTDLATVILGVQWAVDNQLADNIRVLNMSLGFQPFESTVINPLDQAAQAAWNSGIAVVTSAGNAGPSNGTILSPGDDPLVITVGALDDMAQPSVADDEMTNFSSAGPTSPDGWVKPDLVTSGRSVVSLAAPGSAVYNDYPSARVGSANFVGSGTSFSTAITSGAAALILAADPSLTPDQLKARLLGTTSPGPVGNPFVDGHGALNVYAAATTAPMNLGQSVLGTALTLIGSTVSLSPVANLASSWNANLWSGVSWPQGSAGGGGANDPAPSGSAWNGSAWNGFTWSSKAWNDGGWTGADWDSQTWQGSAWDGTAWQGSAWNSAAWNSSAWSASQWN
ncbi:MAG TPA: S8 family peptidase [Streptosporangiaceae bacterium]|nr:S8 family peptidase [Streptosporangiaceae bacterium]